MVLKGSPKLCSEEGERIPMVIFLPPKENGDADTDQDSDLSDSESTDTTLNLPARLLQSEDEANISESETNSIPEKLNNKCISWVDRQPETHIPILPPEQPAEFSFQVYDLDFIPDYFIVFLQRSFRTFGNSVQYLCYTEKLSVPDDKLQYTCFFWCTHPEWISETAPNKFIGKENPMLQ